MKGDRSEHGFEESEARDGSASNKAAMSSTSFGWRVLVLFGRQITFLCSLNLFRLPFVCFYYFYVWMPLFFLALFLKYALVVLQVSSRRSSSFKRLIKHYIAFHKTIINIIRKIRRSSLSELTEWILTTIFEVVFTIFDESEESLYDVRLGDPLHFAELIGYMEMEEQHCPQQRRRDKHMRHLMHHHVPSQPFRASVRVLSQPGSGSSGPQSSTPSSSRKPMLSNVTQWLQQKRQRWLHGRGSRQGTDSDYLGALSSNSFGFLSSRTGHMTAGTCSVSDLWSEVESVSRTSIPQSPETFARVMDRSRDRVDSVVFFVRDKLRLEERRQSHDEKCRSMASQLLSKGKFGVFDPYHTNRALELMAGLHCAGVRAFRKGLRSGSSPSLVASSPKKPLVRGQGGGNSGNTGEEQVTSPVGLIVTEAHANNGKSSVNSLARTGSTGSLSNSPLPPLASPLFFSTRAAIPLLQDAFVYFEYFIKSATSGSLTSYAGGSGGIRGSALTSSPVVCLGLASCDFSLDAMVGDDDRSVGLGLFPEDCQHHACRLYLSGTGCEDRRRRAVAERLEDDEADDHQERELNRDAGAEKYSFDMLGGTASSGDRIGVLVYICGKGVKGGRSSFGKDLSNDCLYANMEDGSGRLRQNSVDSIVQLRAGCTPHPARCEIPDDDECHYEYEYDLMDSMDNIDEDDEDDEERPSNLSGLLHGLEEEDDDEEEGMHVHFNLNGCPLNVPLRALSKIADMPWGETALYPTVSFTVPPCASEPDSPPEGQLQQPNGTSVNSFTSSKSDSSIDGGSAEKAGSSKDERDATKSATLLPLHNTVKIWGGFCVDDVECRSREAIGAPPGVCVYCLDGSVLLGEDEQ